MSVAKIDHQDWTEGLRRVVFPKRPDRREWIAPVIDYLNARGIVPNREELIVAWDKFSSSRDAQWLGADENTMSEFVEWILEDGSI